MAQIEFSLRACAHIVRCRHAFDVLYLPMAYFPAPLLVVLGRLLRRPVVVRIARGEASRTRKPLAVLRQRMLRLASAVVVLNEDSAVRLRQLGVRASDICYIPNGVDTDRFHPVSDEERRRVRARLGIDEDEFVVMYVGSICRRKGVEALIQAFGMFVARGAKGRLLLVGPTEGAEAEPGFVEEIRRSVDENELGCSVALMGRSDCVEQALQASDVFVLPSRAEGMPNALLEAMATGLPCIGTDIPGIREIVRSGENGLLVSTDDPAAIADRVAQLLGDRALRDDIGRRARSTARSLFSIQETAVRYQALFSRLAARSVSL